MEPVALVWTIVAAVFAGASAVAAVYQARVAELSRRHASESKIAADAARDEARAARDEARALAEKANNAFERQALALEESNEIERSKLPKPGARFELVHIRGALWTLVNDGTETATGASLRDVTTDSGWVRFEHTGVRDVPPGDGFEFSILSNVSGAPSLFRLEVKWTTSGGELVAEAHTAIPS